MKRQNEIIRYENHPGKGKNRKRRWALWTAVLLALALVPATAWAVGGAQNGQPMQQGNLPSNGMIQRGGMQQQIVLAESAGEIAVSTAENAAAGLEADLDSAVSITMSADNSDIEITESGTYVITGSCADGGITVKKGVTGVVLVLDDLDLASASGAAVSVSKEAQAKIVISGSVTLTDAENPADETSADEAIADAYDGAAMKFKASSQVCLTGDGTLTLNGSAKNGIKCGDDSSLIIDGDVTVNITAANDGINGGYDVTLLGGTITVSAGDDALHADHILTVGSEEGGPTVSITRCQEGLEATVVNVFGGEVTIQSSDDAINAANADGRYADELAYSFNMTGGSVTINSQVDGIDSNGSVNLIGGSATIHSAYTIGDAGIDYDGQYYLSADFQLNNDSGVSGPDGMGGMMRGQMGRMNGQMGQMDGFMNGRNGWNGSMDGAPFDRGAEDGTLPDSTDQASDGQFPSFGQGRPFGGQGPWGGMDQQAPNAQGDGQTPPMNGGFQPGFGPGQGFDGSMPNMPFGQQGLTGDEQGL